MISVSIENYNQLKTCLNIDFVDNIILPIDCFDIKELDSLIDEVYSHNKTPIIKFERISRYNEHDFIKKDTIEILNKHVDNFIVENIDCFSFIINNVYNKKININLDYTMNITNNLSKDFYKNIINNDNLIVSFTQSLELNKHELKQLDFNEYIVYGYVPMMVTANCIFKNMNKCMKNSYDYFVDRKNKKLLFKSYCKYCYNKIFNSDVLYIYDLIKNDEYYKNKNLRFEFTIETEEEIKNILLKNTKPVNFTRGHFNNSMI